MVKMIRRIVSLLDFREIFIPMKLKYQNGEDRRFIAYTVIVLL